MNSVKPTWNEGKNLTRKVVTKTVKSKPKGKGKNKKPVTRKITEEVPCESFFNFFNTTELPKDVSTLEEEEASEMEAELQMELDVGQTLCEDVIPRAVLYYTGAVCEEDDDDDMGDFDEDEDDDEDGDDDDDAEDDDEDEDDDEEEEEGQDKEGAPKQNQETPEECKQQ